jgi:hypothetical protein
VIALAEVCGASDRTWRVPPPLPTLVDSVQEAITSTGIARQYAAVNGKPIPFFIVSTSFSVHRFG